MTVILGGRWEVLRTLGAGAGGEVLLAADRLAGGAHRAVKVLADAARERNLRAEFAALAGLQHPGVVKLHGFGHDATRGPLLVTDFVDGTDLLTAGASLDEAGKLALVAQLLRTLAFVHARGLLHLDLKPANVLVEAGRTRLLDFGLAGAEWSRAVGATPAWAAPEQLRGAAVDRRTDLHAVGALAHALATGSPPPQQREREAAAAAIAGGLGEVVRLLLREDPETRPASAGAALAQLAARGVLDGADEAAGVAAWIPHVPAIVRRGALADAAAALDGGRPVALLGPGGSGRRSLLGEIARRRAGGGWIVLRGGAGAAPLEPLLPVLRGAAALLQPGDAKAARRLLAPWLDGSAPATKAPAAAALGAAAAAIVAAAAKGRRLLVLLDGADTLEPVSRVAMYELLAQRVPVVLSAEEAPDAPALREIALAPLDLEAVKGWLAGVYPDRAVPEGFAASLHRWSGGLPILIEEALRALASSGLAAPGVGSSAPLPAVIVDEQFPARAEAAGRTAARALLAARDTAVLLGLWGRPLAVVDLAGLLGLSEEAALLQVEALAAEGAAVLEEGGLCRIAGEAVAAAVAGALPAAAAAAVHLRLAAHAAGAAARARGAEATVLLAARARHLLAGGDPEGPAVALRAGLACATCAAHRETVELLGAALQRGLGDGPARCALAAAQAALGDVEGALHAYRAADAEGAGAEAAIGAAEVLIRRGAYREAVSELEGVEADGTQLRARLFASLAKALALSGRAGEARDRAEAGLAVIASLPEPERAGIAADLHGARGLAHYLAGEADAALAAYEAAEAAAIDAEDPGRRATAANGRAIVAHRRGELALAEALYGEALRHARDAWDLTRVGACHLNLGALAQERSDTASAAEQYRQSAAVGRALGDPHAVARAELNLAVLHRFVGRLEAAIAAATAARSAAMKAGAPHVAAIATAVEGETRLLGGEVSRARGLLEEGLAGTTGAAEKLDIEVALGQAELAAGEAGAAAARAAAVAEASASLPAIRMRALLLRAEALLLGAAPDVPAARRALFEALSLAESHPRPDVRWRLHRALHLAHRAAGEGDLARAEAVAAQRLLAAAAEVPQQDRTPFLARPDRRRAQEELALSGPIAGADGSAARILALNRRIGEERDADRLLAAITDAAIELSGAERGFVLLPAAEGSFEIRMARGFADPGEDVPVSRSIAERVLRSGEPEHAVDALHDDRYRDQLSIHDLRLRSVICLPLSFRGERVGALYLDNRLRSRVFDDEAVALLESFADQAGIALGNARLLAETEAARQRADEAAAQVRKLAARLEEQVEQQAAELATAREVLGDQPLAGIVGQSEPIRRLCRAIEKVAAVAVPVLVQGESGTGKELVARAIHAVGPRQDRPFVAVNCAALAETVLESELFGHVRGAFTGADRDRRGLFELADGGTLMLDEVADMSLGMQAKLLRALQSGEIWKVGGRAALRVDVRVVAATNKPLAGQVEQGLFREDLFYRLNVVTLPVPPLRERPEDIPLLVEHFLRNIRGEAGQKRKLRIEPAAISFLATHEWPGNVRELEATLKNAAIFAEGNLIRTSDLSFLRLRMATPRVAAEQRAPETVPLAEAELEMIERTLEKTGGNKALAARLLGIDRKTLYNKLRRLERA
ncbi:sigma 54-interacting transcriptional regulator [Vulgatibacter sp.]|uniref:sigma 54-interacting transcriptional regulator n=1 Tax=Vulgatibacter sp. TaxID=1971226 RepID=UPI003566658F